MSANSSLHPVLTYCFESRPTVFIFTAMLIANTLLLTPLLFSMAYLGVRQWRKQRSAPAAATLSHSDFFAYNMAALEITSLVGSCFYCFGGSIRGQNLQAFGNSVFYLTSPGQTLIHLLTCVERYLAVVHPITYLSLRQAGALRIRNATTGCVWLLCLGLMALSTGVSSALVTVTTSTIFLVSIILVSFFSFSVLRVLTDPGPGEVGADRQRVHQSKHKAFHTIVAIMVAEVFRLVGVMVCSVLFNFSALSDLTCAVASSFIWLAVPCGLVLPVLFLQRAGKLPATRDKTNRQWSDQKKT